MQDIADIRNQLSSKDLFDAFKAQLAKDFAQSNFPVDFIDALSPDYGDIHTALVREMQRSEKWADAGVMNLLNRIDISEPQLKKYLATNKNESRFNVIAELIIKRVLQKVVIKRYYKHKEGS